MVSLERVTAEQITYYTLALYSVCMVQYKLLCLWGLNLAPFTRNEFDFQLHQNIHKYSNYYICQYELKIVHVI